MKKPKKWYRNLIIYQIILNYLNLNCHHYLTKKQGKSFWVWLKKKRKRGYRPPHIGHGLAATFAADRDHGQQRYERWAWHRPEKHQPGSWRPGPNNRSIGTAPQPNDFLSWESRFHQSPAPLPDEPGVGSRIAADHPAPHLPTIQRGRGIVGGDRGWAVPGLRPIANCSCVWPAATALADRLENSVVKQNLPTSADRKSVV